MRLYLAGIYASGIHKQSWYYREYWNEVERAAIDNIQYMLESYHYVKSQNLIKKLRNDGARFFLDSGAYSAYTKGSEISIGSYCQFIKDHHDLIERSRDDTGREYFMASVLDAIGSAEKTWVNQKRIEDAGIPVLPCFHYGEPEEALQYYLEHYNYITIGGMVPISTPQLILWLDRIWKDYLTDESGRPRLKVHGFGLTAIHLMQRYPWYSVDSAAWVQKAMFGNVIFPDIGIVQISEHSPAAKRQGAHFDNIAPPMRDAVRSRIESAGFDPERLRTNRDSRIAFNIHTFTQLMTQVGGAKTFVPQQPVFF